MSSRGTWPVLALDFTEPYIDIDGSGLYRSLGLPGRAAELCSGARSGRPRLTFPYDSQSCYNNGWKCFFATGMAISLTIKEFMYKEVEGDTPAVGRKLHGVFPITGLVKPVLPICLKAGKVGTVARVSELHRVSSDGPGLLEPTLCLFASKPEKWELLLVSLNLKVTPSNSDEH